ncbi:MAG: type II toxin-antitoxin system HicA family toxin [Patescibacteria group bacterium]
MPILTARAVLQKLARAGFRIIYTKGSHYYLKHPITNRITSVPMHGSKDIDRGLLSKIIKQAGLSIKEFIKL